MTVKYVIDGLNVCWWYSKIKMDTLSINPLLTILCAILENGDDFYCVFDASVTHNLNDQNRTLEAKAVDALIKDYHLKFFRVTASTRADSLILHNANTFGLKIITNDIYQDYRGKYSWLKDKHTDRLIQGNLEPSGLLTIEKIPYGNLSLQDDTERALSRLRDLLDHWSPSETQELGKQKIEQNKGAGKYQALCSNYDMKTNDLASKTSLLEKKYSELNNQIEIQKKEINLQTAKRKTLQEEINVLTLELDETRAYLEALLEIRDFDKIEKDMKTKLSELKSEISSLEIQRSKKENALNEIATEVNAYQTILRQKKDAEEKHELELQDDQTYIKKAQAEITKFLEPYSHSGGFHTGPIKIPFQGTTWEDATKRLRIFFDRNRICTHCYTLSPMFNFGTCDTCNKGKVTDNPLEIWKIVNSCAPRKNVYGIIKSIIGVTSENGKSCTLRICGGRNPAV